MYCIKYSNSFYYFLILQDRMGHRVEDQRLSIFLQDNDTLLQSNIYHNIDVQLDTYGKNMSIIYTSLCKNSNGICYIYINRFV